MKIRCIWEHNGNDTLLFSENCVGAFTRGESPETALKKMPTEIASYLTWRGLPVPESFETEIVQEKISALQISDADSDVLFETEKVPLALSEYEMLKELALKSARDFLALYESVPNKNESCLPARRTFYGQAPRTALEMYEHTRNVNNYYFGEIGIEASNEGDIFSCRARGFEKLETHAGFLANEVFKGSYGEEWSLRKVLRRFVWHDRIHAKAMYRMAVQTFGPDAIRNVFQFIL